MDLISEPTSDKGIRVLRRCGAATNTGVNYEDFMFLSVLLRLLEDDHIERFYIAQNVDEVGAFDDLIFLIKYQSIEEEYSPINLFLVQLKHVNRPVSLAALTATSGKGDFKLLKYYEDFKNVVNNSGNFKNKILNECRVEDMTFVVYTNAGCPSGDNNYPNDSLCRKFLETGEETSKVFSFNSTKQFEKFHDELAKNNNPISKDVQGEQFLRQLVFFADQSSITDLQENLKGKLGNYFSGEVISGEDILQRAVNFIAENNGMWMSRHSGVLTNITINFQGFQCKYWESTEISRKIIIKYICREKGNAVRVGKVIHPPKKYYVERKVIKDCSDTNSDDHDYSEQHKKVYVSNILDQEFVILSAGPGMGKSELFTHQAHVVKTLYPKKYVIRENLLDHITYLNDLNVTDHKKLIAGEFLARIAGVKPDSLDYDVFVNCLLSENMMVVFLDGMDEISPHYFDKVCIAIQAIREEFRIQLMVSTRPILQNKMKQYFKTDLLDLLPFTGVDALKFLNKYCGPRDYVLSDAERDLCGFPLFCKMIGDIINSSNGSSSNGILSKVDLYDKFIEVMYQLYHKEKEKGNIDVPLVRNRVEKQKEAMTENYERAAMLTLFLWPDMSELMWNMATKYLDFIAQLSQGFENIGIINDVNIKNNKVIFIHRSIPEYFCGQWFARNMEIYKEYDKLFRSHGESFPEEVDYFMSSKLNNLHPLFTLVLNVKDKVNIENSLKQYINDFNILDPFGRNVMHYVNIVDNTNALKYILFNGINLTQEIIAPWDNEWPHFRIRETTYIYLLFRWLVDILKKYPQHGHLLGLILMDDRLDIYPASYFLQHYSKNSPLHKAILNGSKQDIAQLIAEHLNSTNDIGLTPLHLAVWMKDADTVELLGENGAEYSSDNVLRVFPHEFFQNYFRIRDIDVLLKHFYSEFMQTDILRADILSQDYILENMPFHNTIQNHALWRYYKTICNGNVVTRWLLKKKIKSQIYMIDSKGRTAMHVAAANSELVIFILLKFINDLDFKYTADVHGYYPHHYVENDYAHWKSTRIPLMRFGFKFILSRLLASDKYVCGIDLVDVLKLLKLDT